MGMTAENVARTFGITRHQQDEFALNSHVRAVAAQKSGNFDDEIAPVTIRTRKGDILIDEDDGPRADTNLDKLRRLRTVFVPDGVDAADIASSSIPDNRGKVMGVDRVDPDDPFDGHVGESVGDTTQILGTVTAGNASGINDGAAALILMRKDLAQERGIDYLAEISGYAEGGINPDFMGYAPKRVIEKLLDRTGTQLDQIDLFEINEAFASQSIAVSRQLGIPEGKLNVNGGAIALGHPLGASGARILVTLLYAMRARGKRSGVAALCVGGGIGVAMQVAIDEGDFA